MLQFLVSGVAEDRAPRSPRPSRGPRSAVHGSGVLARAGRCPSGLLAIFLWPPPESLGLCLGLYAVIQVPKTLGVSVKLLRFQKPLTVSYLRNSRSKFDRRSP